MVRSYAELQTLLADNITGEISPQDLRDFLDSVATERANIYDQGLAQSHVTSNTAFVKPTLTVTGDASDRFTINTDGTVTLTGDGVFSLIYYFRVDLSDVGTLLLNDQLFLQLYDATTGDANSTEVDVTKTTKSDHASLRLQSEHERAGSNITIEPRFASTADGRTVIVNEVYISVNSVPVVKT